MNKRWQADSLAGFLTAWCVLASPCFADSPTLDELLQKTGSFVEIYWQQLSYFTCTESVTQEKIGKQGKVTYKQDSVFDYLALAKRLEDDLTVEESRVQRRPIPQKPNSPSILSTNGFPTLLLIFHPLYQENYQFRFDEDGDPIAGLRGIRFEHIPGMRSTSGLLLQGRVHPLEFRGTALIDVETGAVLKITAELITPMKSINIESFRAEVRYDPQRFSSNPESVWLPSAATIEMHTAKQHWRNVHRFSEYKHFTVRSTEAISR
jgi:hypothetical protein